MLGSLKGYMFVWSGFTAVDLIDWVTSVSLYMCVSVAAGAVQPAGSQHFAAAESKPVVAKVGMAKDTSENTQSQSPLPVASGDTCRCRLMLQCCEHLHVTPST